MPDSALAPVSPAFRALAATVVPDALQLDAAGWREIEAIVDGFLSERPRRLRLQVRLLIRFLEWLPLFGFGHRFTGLDLDRRAAFLARIQGSPLLLLRRGFWGLRTLVFMGYYGRPAAAAEIGYRAERRGWEARR